MKLSSLLENRTELLHMQQKLIDRLPDEVDVSLDTFARRDVVTVTMEKATCMVMNTPADLEAHQSAALILGRSVAGRVSILIGKNGKNWPVNTYGLTKYELHSRLNIAPWVSFNDLDTALNAIKPFLIAGLTENKIEPLREDRIALLQLQQTLIDELPDKYEVDLANIDKLGDCVVVTFRPSDTINLVRTRFLKPSDDATRILSAGTTNKHWGDFPYDSMLRLIKAWINLDSYSAQHGHKHEAN